jgi:hypothetical protein
MKGEIWHILSKTIKIALCDTKYLFFDGETETHYLLNFHKILIKITAMFGNVWRFYKSKVFFSQLINNGWQNEFWMPISQ